MPAGDPEEEFGEDEIEFEPDEEYNRVDVEATPRFILGFAVIVLISSIIFLLILQL